MKTSPFKTRDVSSLKQMSPDAVSIAEAARRLSVSPRTVQRLISRKHLHAARLGRSVRVPISEIARLLTPPPFDFGEKG
jgi:excisionase family DNA binding protein